MHSPLCGLQATAASPSLSDTRLRLARPSSPGLRDTFVKAHHVDSPRGSRRGCIHHYADCRPQQRHRLSAIRAYDSLGRAPQDFVIHSLRHTMLTRLGEAGADAFTIMRIAGHSSVTVSQRYVHPTPEGMERAFERLEQLNADKYQTAEAEAKAEAAGGSSLPAIFTTAKKAGLRKFAH